MCLSMGSLWTSVIGVMPRLRPLKVKWREMRWMSYPSPVQFPGWRVAITERPNSWGEVPILGYVSERLMVDDPHTELWLFRAIPDGCNQMLWHKCATSAECKTIRIAASAVRDSWKGHTVASSELLKRWHATGDLWLELERWMVNLTWITTELWDWN